MKFLNTIGPVCEITIDQFLSECEDSSVALVACFSAMAPKKVLSESQIVRLSQVELLSQLKAWGAEFNPRASLLRLRVILLDAIQDRSLGIAAFTAV